MRGVVWPYVHEPTEVPARYSTHGTHMSTLSSRHRWRHLCQWRLEVIFPCLPCWRWRSFEDIPARTVDRWSAHWRGGSVPATVRHTGRLYVPPDLHRTSASLFDHVPRSRPDLGPRGTLERQQDSHRWSWQWSECSGDDEAAMSSCQLLQSCSMNLLLQRQ